MIKNIEAYKTYIESEYRRVKEKLDLLGKANKEDKNNYDTNSEELNIDTSDREEVAYKIENFETRVGEEAELEKRLYQVTLAKDAIANNTYGICSICGSEIKEERLNANPISTTCVECSSIGSTSSSL